MLNLNINRKPKTVIRVKHQAPSKVLVWRPRLGEKVIYFCEDRQEFRTGIFMYTWLEYSQGKEASPFLHECLPYCGSPEKQVTRVFILDPEGFSDYADTALIGEWSMANLEWAHSENLTIREQSAIERLAAFGEVEAVA